MSRADFERSHSATRPAVDPDDDPVLARSLAGHLAQLSRDLAADPAVDDVLRRVVDAAAREIPEAEFVGVTVLERDRAITPVFTHDLVVRIDELQYLTGEGPVLETAVDQAIVRVDDLAEDPRWPMFSREAVALGVRSILAFQLFVDSAAVGGLNLYASAPRAFTADAERTGYLLAAHAAVAMIAARERTGLRAAIDGRDVIGQAKGILMERHKVSAQRAFDILITVSQRSNVKLREIARMLVETGALPQD